MDYLLLALNTIIAAFAGYFLKSSGGGNGFIAILCNKNLYIGGFLYTLSSLISIWLLQRMPYSVFLPLGSVCYIWTLAISAKFLGEKISRCKVSGVALIVIGVLLVAR
jgi:uncharacterized membrane protein